jgi:hypothetical protein
VILRCPVRTVTKSTCDGALVMKSIFIIFAGLENEVYLFNRLYLEVAVSLKTATNFAVPEGTAKVGPVREETRLGLLTKRQTN